MRTARSLFLASAACAAALACVAADEPPPPDSAAEHSASHSDRSKRAFYPADKFDLSALPSYAPQEQVSGTLRVWGNNYIGDSDLGKWWADAFARYHPGIQFDYNLPSASIAIPAIYFGLADIGMNHEPHFYDHLAHVRMKGFEPTGISVVTGSYNVGGWQPSIVIIVNSKNPVSKISVEELDGVFGAERIGGWVGHTWHPEFARGPEKNIRTWGQLGVKGPQASHRIHTYGYSIRYATALEFSNRVLQASDKWNEGLRTFANYRRADGSMYLQSDQILDRLKEDPDGIAMIRYISKFPPEIKVLAVAEKKKGPYYGYTIENARERKYPLWGDQSFWVSAKPGTAMDPKVREFIRFVLSREGQELVQKDGKYLPLTAGIAREELKKVR